MNADIEAKVCLGRYRENLVKTLFRCEEGSWKIIGMYQISRKYQGCTVKYLKSNKKKEVSTRKNIGEQ